MTERLGDFAAHRAMAGHGAFVSEMARRHGGETVEIRGDGFLLAFASARSAVRCAIELQRGLDRLRRERPADAISTRTGLHSGPAIAHGDGYFGRNVILAARIAERAAPDEILVSARVRELAGEQVELRTDAGRRLSLKGFASREQVFALSWAEGSRPSRWLPGGDPSLPATR